MADSLDSDFSSFYHAFSARFRGPHELVKARLRVHAEFLAAAKLPGPAVDLGVGRGEWIELAREHGFHTIAVDNNPDIVAAARNRGFEVVEADALDYLAQAPEGSLGAVTGFHLIEHLQSPQRLRFVRDAWRALARGGWLILEWPNMRHPLVAQYTFWLDPTHQSPLPSELMAFMAEYAGFEDIAIVRLDAGRPVSFEAFDVALRARKP